MSGFDHAHCCHTCLYSENNGLHAYEGDYQIWCDYAANTLLELGFAPVTRPLVEAESRCPHYEADDDKFADCHGYAPEEFLPCDLDDLPAYAGYVAIPRGGVEQRLFM